METLKEAAELCMFSFSSNEEPERPHYGLVFWVWLRQYIAQKANDLNLVLAFQKQRSALPEPLFVSAPSLGPRVCKDKHHHMCDLKKNSEM